MAHIPLRMCVACRSMKPTSELIRFVINSQTNTAELDIHKKKFGRGAYLCRNIDCIKKAEKRRAVERSLKCGADSDLYNNTKNLT